MAILILLVVLTAGLLVGLFMYRSGRQPGVGFSTAEPALPAWGAGLPTPRSVPTPTPQPAATPSGEPRPLPLALQELPWPHADSLPVEQKRQLLSQLNQIPRPPRAFMQLVSPDFVARASSVELSELVMSEPAMAARVIATVNSPAYGLQRTVSSIGQGVTFLGLNTVRAMCLRHLLVATAVSPDPSRRQALDRVWASLSLSSELASRLAQKLAMPDAGGLVTEVVLSHLGRIAALRLMSTEQLTLTPAQTASMVERVRASVGELGVPSSEVVRMLLDQWELPATLCDAVAAVDRVLITPPPAALGEAAIHSRRVLAYLCSRLGERLANGQLTRLDELDLNSPGVVADPDLHHACAALTLPPLVHLPAALRDISLVDAMTNLVASMRGEA